MRFISLNRFLSAVGLTGLGSILFIPTSKQFYLSLLLVKAVHPIISVYGTNPSLISSLSSSVA